MFKSLLLLFIVIPIIEISILVHVGQWLGAWPTVAIVIITAWLGAKNVKQQGLNTMQSVQSKMAQGQMPSEEIVAGMLLLVAGVLLLTPGFVTDAFGLLLLVPAFRQALIGTVQQHLKVNVMQSANFTSSGFEQRGFDQQDVFESHSHDETPTKQDKNRPGNTLDGEFERKD